MTDPSQARDVESLRAAIAGGAQAEYLCFWGHTAKGARAVGPWVLSQWFEAPFEVDGVRYPTAEHWMMAGKAELFGDAQSRDQILRASSSREAKALGRRVRGFDDQTWCNHRLAIVVEGSMHKFSRDPVLRGYLLNTAPHVLVEASPVDRIWGIGLAADHQDATHPERWQGLNLLGFALMEARTRLQAKAPAQ